VARAAPIALRSTGPHLKRAISVASINGPLIQAVFASTNPAVRSQDQTYTYNTAGNRASTVINGVSTAYVSNDKREYMSVEGATYIYGTANNLTSDGTDAYA
jgi:YD repeat-containing protein